MCRLWSKLLHASLSLAFGHLTLGFQICFSGAPLVGSLLGVHCDAHAAGCVVVDVNPAEKTGLSFAHLLKWWDR